MNQIFIIFRKELKDTIRDRKAMFFMVVIPMIVFPLLFGGVISIQNKIMQKEIYKHIHVAMIGKTIPTPLLQAFEKDTSITIIRDIFMENADSLITIGKLDLALEITNNFSEKVENNESGIIYLHYKTEDGAEQIIKKRITDKIDAYSNFISKQRITALNLTEEFIKPVNIIESDLASSREKIGKTVGGILPYIFILFCFAGAMYPAIDLGAGEKERGTLETLLVVPATRMEILMGKFGVITLSGLLSAMISFFGIFVCIQFVDEIPEEIIKIGLDLLQPSIVFLILTLMIPIALLFAASLLILSIYAKSFKEAQSIITPLNFAIFFPIFIGMIPGIHLNINTAVIPIINVTLAFKEVIAGTGNLMHMFLVYFSSFAYAFLGIYACSKWFQRENVVFRD